MSKRLRSSEVCADCSSPDPSWASVNRGVLLCDECCGVHRSLGRHVSQVRHLHLGGPWPPTLRQMVETLSGNGANAIWEHSLLDPASVLSGRRKAAPHDRLHPNKVEFIRAKYQMLAFVHRLPCREDDGLAARDLSKQLHSSVRTGNLETCLRLLSLGAQPNFFHPEKGSTPLHVAARTGQALQAELLAVYGADPGTPDAAGKTPVQCAKQGGHLELAERLVEIQYELTDRLAFYLCGRKPDHKNGQHFIIPQMADRRLSLDVSELAKAAKKKLQSLSNHLFEELAMDIYDEVDRRETDAVWLATQNHSALVTEAAAVPFLPVNPEYSSTRNQGRQKLARFNAHEFATLVIDVLRDAKRRQQQQQGGPDPGSKGEAPPRPGNVELILKPARSPGPCDQPDYDSVASDEEGGPDAGTDKTPPSPRQKSLDSDPSDGPITAQDFLQVRKALSASEAKIQQLMKVNLNLSDELKSMQKKLQTLQSENSNLRRQASSGPFPASSEHPDPGGHVPSIRRPSGNRPMSMYETGSAQKPYFDPEEEPFAPYSSKFEKETASPEGDYENAAPDENGKPRCVLRGEGLSSEDAALPGTEDVIRRTEQITKNIQELLRAAQENKHESYVPCSERIQAAVTEMAALFPKAAKSELVRSSLRLLTASACRLRSECARALPPAAPADVQPVTQPVIQCAYDIAKAAKQLVTSTTQENQK